MQPLIFKLLPCNSSTREAFEIATVPPSTLELWTFRLPESGGTWKTKSTSRNAYMWREGGCWIGSTLRSGILGAPVEKTFLSGLDSQLFLAVYFLSFDNMNVSFNPACFLLILPVNNTLYYIEN